MPMKPLPYCSRNGCGQRAVTGSRYCAEHRPKPGRQRVDTRTTTQRGYGADWQRASDAYSAEHPTCEKCGEPRIAVRTPVRRRDPVHHKVSPDVAPHLRLEPSNMVAECRACHEHAHERHR